MKKNFFFSCIIISAVLVILHSCNSKESTAEVKGATAEIANSLKAKLPPEVVKNFEDVIADMKEDPASIKGLGLYAHWNRNPELAAWLYALAAGKKEDDHDNLSNLGTTLVEIYLAGKEKDPKLFDKGVELLRSVVNASKDNASANNNLGYALFKKYQ